MHDHVHLSNYHKALNLIRYEFTVAMLPLMCPCDLETKCEASWRMQKKKKN